MKKILIFLLITVFILSLSPIADAKPKFPKIIGCEEFITIINEALLILQDKDPNVYQQIYQVKKIVEAKVPDAQPGYTACAFPKKRIIYVDLGQMYNFYDRHEDELAWLVCALSHEFNHVANRKVKNRLENERLALAQQLNTAIAIGAPQFLINYFQEGLNNIDNPVTWWWSPAFAE
jgi:hypothetical protein